VSLCLIVKDEEANLADCLGSAADLVDEIIVVDTGSSDRTKEIAARFGARVFDWVWVDSFAAARNESLLHATGQWIFWLDADDRLDEDNRARLRALFAKLGDDNAAYVMKCLCLPDPAAGTFTAVDHVRLFRNRPELRWSYRVHEQILPAVRQAGAEVRWTDVVIRHTGYQDPALRRRKLDRDLRLLRLEEAERPGDPFTLFNLGQVHQERGELAEAVACFRRSLEGSQPTDSIVRKLYALLAQCQRQLGQKEAALASCREGRGHYPDDVELLFQEALALRENGDLPGAEACLRRLLEGGDGPHFASLDTGLAGFKARHNLGVLCQDQGRPAEAEEQWRAALAERPDFVPARLSLADLYLGQGRWEEVEQAAQELEGAAPLEAALLRARAGMARREFPAARRLLEEAVVQFPREVRPRVVLSHALLQEGRDWEAAERALQAVLALDGGHEESRHNLRLLRERQKTNGHPVG
jgi:tetratricopeptide (TPR) repeat protein